MTSISPPSLPPPPAPHTAARELAHKMEAAFLAEMLKHTPIGKVEGDFAGGVGADQMRSFLLEAYARELSETNAIGLADILYRSIQKRADQP